MAEVAGLTRWELFKLVRRWMPWILLGVLVVFTQMTLWGSYFSYNDSGSSEVHFGLAPRPGEAPFVGSIRCDDLMAGRVPPELAQRGEELRDIRFSCQQAEQFRLEHMADQRANFMLPSSIPNALQNTQILVLLLGGILAAATTGIEYSLGTLRPILALGTGRLQFLAAKLATLTLVAGAGIIAAATMIALSSLLAASMAGDAPGASTGATWGDAVLAIGRAWYAVMPLIALIVAVTVLTRSTATGLTIGLGYLVIEPVAVGILRSLFEWFEGVSDFMLVRNIFALSGVDVFDAAPSHTRAMLVLLAYACAFAAVALYSFLRRDITGTRV